jgi:hypothetical protein
MTLILIQTVNKLVFLIFPLLKLVVQLFSGPDVVDLSVDSQLQVFHSIILLGSVADRNFSIPDRESKVKKIPDPHQIIKIF